MLGRDVEEEVAGLSRRQHGLITDDQLRQLGVTERMIRWRLSQRIWTRVDREVLRITGVAVSWESDLLARVLAAGEGAVASHRSAAVLHGLDGFRPGAPELSVPRGRRYDRDGVRTHRSTDLDWIQPVRRRGIPVTPLERTFLDLCGVVSPERVLLAIDEARRRQATDWDRLLTCLVLHARQGRRGVTALRAIIDAHFDEVEATDSGFERLVLVLLAGAGLPTPVLHHRVQLDDRCYVVDLAYPERRVAIELDGSIHLRRDIWERDHGRQNGLVLAGWTVLRFTWQDYLKSGSRIVREVRVAVLQ